MGGALPSVARASPSILDLVRVTTSIVSGKLPKTPYTFDCEDSPAQTSLFHRQSGDVHQPNSPPAAVRRELGSCNFSRGIGVIWLEHFLEVSP
jgi:hypothetical protein